MKHHRQGAQNQRHEQGYQHAFHDHQERKHGHDIQIAIAQLICKRFADSGEPGSKS